MSSSSTSSAAAAAAAAAADAPGSATNSETGGGASSATAATGADRGSGERKRHLAAAGDAVVSDGGGAASRTAAGEADADAADEGAGAGAGATATGEAGAGEGGGAVAPSECKRLRVAEAGPAEPAEALDLGTRAAWKDVTDHPKAAAKEFCTWRADSEQTELDLRYLDLLRFPAGFWDQVQGVEKLALESNDLTELPAELGRLGASLRSLVLIGNRKLTAFSGAALGQLTVLDVLNLYSSGLASLPDELFAMASLRNLSLSDCDALKTVGPAEGAFPRIWQMSNLTKLFPDRCGLRGELDAAVGNLVNLEGLDLSWNPELTGIPEEALGQLVNLTRLYIEDGKSLVALPASIGRLTRLVRLSCSRSGLETLPPQIGDCRALTTVALEHCKQTR